MPSIGVIVNPYARENRDGRTAERLRDIVGKDGEVIVTRSVDDLAEVFARWRRTGIDMLAVCGGDGSHSRAITRAVTIWGGDALPAYLPLRGGTINNLVRSIPGANRTPPRALARVLATMRSGATPALRERRVLVVDGDHFGHVFGLAMIVEFLRLYYAGRNPGPIRAMSLLARLGLSYVFRTRSIREVAAPVEARIVCDGRASPFDEYTLILAATIEHIGLGVRPFYRVRESTDCFHVLAGPATPGQLLSRLAHVYLGSPPRLASLLDVGASRLTVELGDRTTAWTLDGELIDSERPRITVELGPVLRYVCPRG